MNPVGRYRIESEIGRGAMGIVYKALDPAIGRTVAIKTIHLPDITDPDTRQHTGEQIFREAQAAGTLSHPNIVTVFDVLEQGEFAYIVMEYVAGSSLEEMVRNGQQPAREELLLYLRQIAEALDYAHRKGIIHRDIKPANVLIAAGGDLAKITDFGIAKTIATDITNPGNLVGTPGYMSPEQIKGSRLDGRTDQFSLAVMIYELLSGRKPFRADTLPALLHKILSEEAQPVEDINSALSPTVGKVLGRALAKEPEDRFATASDFIGALSIALAEAFYAPATPIFGYASAVPQATSTPTRVREIDFAEVEPVRRSRTLPLIVVLCFAVAAAIVFIVRLNTPSQVPVQVLETPPGPTGAPPSSSPSTGAPRTNTKQPIPPTPQAPAPKTSAAAPPNTSPQPPAQDAPSHTTPQPAPHGNADQISRPRGVIVPTIPAADVGLSTADVDLVTEPAGAKVMVDGRADAVCNAPCTMALPTGRHTLTAELKGYAMARRIFVLPDTRSLYIPLAQSSGLLILTSEPSGAGITVDGSPFGTTPATLHLTPGIHHIVVARGLQRHEEAVNVEPGSFLTRAIRW